MRNRALPLMIATTLLAAACNSGGAPTAGPSAPSSGAPSDAATPTVPSTAVPSTAAPAKGTPLNGGRLLPAALQAFGSYDAVPLADPDRPVYRGPAPPTSLDGVSIAPELQNLLNRRGVSTTLTREGFAVVPADLRQLHFGYTEAPYAKWPVYVTTDAAYHVWHQVFDSTLRTTEQQVLLPRLEQLLGETLEAAHQQTLDLADTPLADEAARAEQLYQVAAVEAGLDVTLDPLAIQEKALVDAHAGAAISPILESRIDYSLMEPRGHYTMSPALSRYFVAMSVLGQASFCLPGTSACPGRDQVRPLRVGLLATRALVSSPDRVALLSSIYEPTAFLVGLADDYTPPELDTGASSVAPGWRDDPSVFADPAAVRRLASALTAGRTVRIDAEKASVRLMGARFVLDSYVMDQLIAPNVGENAAGERRLLPSALDVAAVLGSELARSQLTATGADAYRGYPERLAQLTRAVARRPDAAWGGTVYDAWLHALQPVLAEHGTAYPETMRGPAWAAKGLQTALGSYAELKHDTILYGKQAVAEGGGDPLVHGPRNWVEPEPVSYRRLAAAADLTRSGLSARGLLTDEQAQLLRDTTDLFTFFATIAEDELTGAPISRADNEQLTYIGESFEGFWFRTSDRRRGAVTGESDAAVVADIASGPEQVLEVGIGRFDRILVLVPDDHGRFELAVGAVFSYYEFGRPAGERLTDEAWRALLDQGTAPPQPGWRSAMLAD